MIIDAHAHAFPFLGNKGVFDSEAEHTRYLQRHMATHPQGGRRFRDNGFADGPTLWDGKTPGFAVLVDVNFRPGLYGRFEWAPGRRGVARRVRSIPLCRARSGLMASRSDNRGTRHKARPGDSSSAAGPRAGADRT